ncbi:MAG TPA: hypothetical protein VEB63_07710 [Chitinophagaceae bacterium]|nr:hypothetical protein [Chitinophagaceae bacterium]
MMRFLLLPVLALAMLQPADAEEKIITITVNQYSQAIIGRDTLTFANLSKELENRLWRHFLGTGKSYDRIVLNFTRGVTRAIRVSAIAAVKSAQHSALKLISLEKEKKLFEDLEPDKQDKIRKQFPVLFQQFS